MQSYKRAKQYHQGFWAQQPLPGLFLLDSHEVPHDPHQSTVVPLIHCHPKARAGLVDELLQVSQARMKANVLS